jgi:hypothetical protein
MQDLAISLMQYRAPCDDAMLVKPSRCRIQYKRSTDGGIFVSVKHLSESYGAVGVNCSITDLLRIFTSLSIAGFLERTIFELKTVGLKLIAMGTVPPGGCQSVKYRGPASRMQQVDALR